MKETYASNRYFNGGGDKSTGVMSSVVKDTNAIDKNLNTNDGGRKTRCEINGGGDKVLVPVFELRDDAVMVQPLARLPPPTRQSLRQKIKGKDGEIQEKAMQLKEQSTSMMKSKGINSLLDHFPYNDLSDEEVVDLFDCFGLHLADNVDECIDHVQFLRSLSKKQFDCALDEMEFKIQYGARFVKKDKDKRNKLDMIISRVHALSIK